MPKSSGYYNTTDWVPPLQPGIKGRHWSEVLNDPKYQAVEAKVREKCRDATTFADAPRPSTGVAQKKGT